MDYFSLCLNSFCLASQSIMHISFVGRFTGARQKIRYFAVYLSLLCIIEWIFSRLTSSGILPVTAQLLILYCITHVAFKVKSSVSWTAAMIAVYISQFSFGIVNSAEAMVFPRLIGKPILYPVLILATLIAFAICACCYTAVLNCLSLTKDGHTPYIGLLLVPGLFFFTAELYILQTSYSLLPVSLSPEETRKHGALLILQALGLSALLCTLFVYRHLLRSFQEQAALQSLTQAAEAQKIYVAEARSRYEQTNAFRHDIKNHLSVLDGLLSNQKVDESRAYLKKLETVSSSLSFPCQSGNPVVDILLGEKLGLAKANGIAAEVSLILPKTCNIDDFDLCVIFANALDNAISACQTSEKTKSISITGEKQGDFYMLEFVNTCSAAPLPPMGTGLSNIRSVADKYHGAILTEKADQSFCLNVLLNISLQAGNSSRQNY